MSSPILLEQIINGAVNLEDLSEEQLEEALISCDRLIVILEATAYKKGFTDLVPPEVAQGMTAAAEASPENSVPVLEDFVRNELMGGARPEIQDALIARLVPQPIALFTTPVSTKDFDALDIPKTVLFCKNDASLPPGAYLGMAQGLGKHDVIELDGGHETLFTDPELFVEGLLKALN